MKYLSKVLIAALLAVLMAALVPVQVFADMPDYISEIKIYEGNYDDAASEGFTILNGDDGKPIDLNRGSGSTDIGAKGNKAVFLGYKTTKVKSEAITDLALMNMKGGYDVAEYEKLMEGQMKDQILPFIDSFIEAVNEYRANYASDNEANKKRALYVHDALNKLTDDDTNGAGLGDLLLNETIYEMAKLKYDALSDKEKEDKSFYDINIEVRDSLPESEKNKHADIATLLAQCNGNATLILKNLVTRGADTNNDLWLERFEGTTYEDLLDLVDGTPTDKRKAVAKKYDDDAQEILKKWDAFQERLSNYDKAVEILEKANEKDLTEAAETVESFDFAIATEQEAAKAAEASVEVQYSAEELANAAADVFCKEYLESIDYGDGTMLDFFTQSAEDIEADITILYPIAASLTKGQQAGLEFISLQDLVMLGSTDEKGYQSAALNEIEPTSVYLGVDRGIYQKGGVALTSNALRNKIVYEETPEKSIALHIWSGVTIGLTLIGASAFIGSWMVKNSVDKLITTYNNTFKSLTDSIAKNTLTVNSMQTKLADLERKGLTELAATQRKNIDSYTKSIDSAKETLRSKGYDATYIERLQSQSDMYKYMRTGAAVFTAAMIVLSAVLIYLDYQSMKDYYNVKYTPIPHYMIEEKDLIGYNEKGEQIVLKNQGAYYKAVECNRKKGDEYFNNVDICADMNGDVGQQWLALYAAKNKAEDPILADSLKVVVGSTAIPEGYETGIHFFGESAAFNLNDKRFCWNQKAKSITVYFKTDSTAASTAGSNITSGSLALAGGCGLLLGACITALTMKTAGKRKENKVQTA